MSFVDELLKSLMTRTLSPAGRPTEAVSLAPRPSACGDLPAAVDDEIRVGGGQGAVDRDRVVARASAAVNRR